MSKLKENYNNSIKKTLQKDLNLPNVNSVPGLEKIVLNVGVGESRVNGKAVEIVQDMLSDIAGQKAVVTKAKKAISNFKIRQGDPIGVKVTLRKDRMWNFYEKLVDIVIPRIKDFRGLSATAFDNFGNYTIGIRDHTVFPEIDPNEIDKIRSFEITLVTTAKNKEESRQLLTALGLPLKK